VPQLAVEHAALVVHSLDHRLPCLQLLRRVDARGVGIPAAQQRTSKQTSASKPQQANSETPLCCPTISRSLAGCRVAQLL
jgi:hypothetical protein